MVRCALALRWHLLRQDCTSCKRLSLRSLYPKTDLLILHRDAFRKYSTEIFILQMMIKNFLFYSFSTFINDFAAKKGPGHMCKVFGIVTLCGFTTCIPMCKSSFANLICKC